MNDLNNKLFMAFNKYSEMYLPTLQAIGSTVKGIVKPNIQEYKYFADLNIVEAYLYCCNDLSELVNYINDKIFTNREIGLIAFRLAQLIFTKFSYCYSGELNFGEVGYQVGVNEYNEPVYDSIIKYSDKLNFICKFLNISKKYTFFKLDSYNKFLEDILLKAAEYDCVIACEVLAEIYNGSRYCEGEPIFLDKIGKYQVWIEYEIADEELSFNYYQKAAKLGSGDAAWAIKEIYKRKGNENLESIWLKYSAFLSNKNALYELGLKYCDMFFNTKSEECYQKSYDLINRFLKLELKNEIKRRSAKEYLKKIKLLIK